MREYGVKNGQWKKPKKRPELHLYSFKSVYRHLHSISSSARSEIPGVHPRADRLLPHDRQGAGREENDEKECNRPKVEGRVFEAGEGVCHCIFFLFLFSLFSFLSLTLIKWPTSLQPTELGGHTPLFFSSLLTLNSILARPALCAIGWKTKQNSQSQHKGPLSTTRPKTNGTFRTPFSTKNHQKRTPRDDLLTGVKSDKGRYGVSLVDGILRPFCFWMRRRKYLLWESEEEKGNVLLLSLKIFLLLWILSVS